MAREAAVTQQDVSAAADAIVAQGGRPTARAVRQMLGTGSMATVLRHLQAWQADQGRKPETPLSFPPGLQKTLTAFVAQEVAAARRAAEEELAIAQQALGDLVAENERQATALQEQQDYVETLQAEKAQLEGRLSQMGHELNEARRQAALASTAAETARTQLMRSEQQLEGLRPLPAELAGVRGALEDERALRFDAQKAAAVSSAKFEQTEARLSDLHERLTRTEAELAQLSESRLALQSELGAVREALDDERALRFEAQKEAAVSSARAEQADAQLVEMQERTARNEAELAQLRQARPAR